MNDDVLTIRESLLDSKRKEFISDMDKLFRETNPIQVAYNFSRQEEESIFDLIFNQSKELRSFVTGFTKYEINYNMRILFFIIEYKLDGYIAIIDDDKDFIRIYTSELGFSKSKMYDVLLEDALSTLRLENIAKNKLN